MGVNEMGLLYKNILKQILNNKVFVGLLGILSFLTSLSYFFVKFSIDGNLENLEQLVTLSENQVLYRNALLSNTTLANIFLLSTCSLTAFVFAMFFYRFHRTNKTKLGCLKALGYKDREIGACFALFTVLISIIGGLFGILGGYFLSEVLVSANERSYAVNDLVKYVNPLSVICGIGIPVMVYLVITCLCFQMIRGKEPGVLMSGKTPFKKLGFTFRLTDHIVKCLPVKEKFPYRIALRKPVAVLMIFIGILVFNVCVILGQSLNKSSQKIMDSQMEGRSYAYELQLEEITAQKVPENAVSYLTTSVKVLANNEKLEQNIVGISRENDFFCLLDEQKNVLSLPKKGEVYINPGVAELYGVKEGDTLSILQNGMEKELTVVAVVSNAEKDSIYCNIEELQAFMNCEAESYNGLWGEEKIEGTGEITSWGQRVEQLERDSVSGKVSAVINQATGAIVGMILLFLSLFLNFQDNKKDMQILRLIGYQDKDIRHIFVDIYWKIVVVFFIIAIIPGILIAQAIQRVLSVAIGDFMPFCMNLGVVVVLFLVLSVLYFLVKTIFAREVRKV